MLGAGALSDKIVSKNVRNLVKHIYIVEENQTNQVTKLAKHILAIEGKVAILTSNTEKPNHLKQPKYLPKDTNTSSNIHRKLSDPKQHHKRHCIVSLQMSI